jgi:hypothetical protein
LCICFPVFLSSSTKLKKKLSGSKNIILLERADKSRPI